MKRACRNLIKFCIVAVLLFALSFAVSAHPGSLDSNGGHWNHSTGTYHLHEGLNTDSGTGNSTSTYSSNIYSSDNSSNSNIVWNNYANAYENNSTDESEVPIPDNTEECEQPVNDIEEFEYPVQDIEEKPSFKEKFFNFWDNILFPILKTIFWILIVFLFIILPISSGVIRSIRESKDRKAAREEWRIRSEVAAEYKDIEEENQRLSDLLKRETQKNKAMRDKFYLQNDELKQLRSIVSNTQIFLSDLYE